MDLATYMNFLVLKKRFQMFKSFSALDEEALVFLATNFILHNVGELRSKHHFDCVLLLSNRPKRVQLHLTFKVNRLFFSPRCRLDLC